jgi:hypothetical protein
VLRSHLLLNNQASYTIFVAYQNSNIWKDKHKNNLKGFSFLFSFFFFFNNVITVMYIAALLVSLKILMPLLIGPFVAQPHERPVSRSKVVSRVALAHTLSLLSSTV